MRPVSIEAGILPAADGSAMVTHGLNVAVAAVYGPMEAHPRKIQRQDRAVIDVRYNMAPFSTGDRIRPGYNRRSREISKVTAEALESVVLVERFPRSKIRVEIEILAAEAGTRCAGLTAAAVALADAGIPMRDLIVGVASGKVEGIVVLDLDKAEDNYGQADLPVGILPNTGEIAFLQMDGDLSPDEYNLAMEYNFKAAAEIHEIMVDALKRRYEGGDPCWSNSYQHCFAKNSLASQKTINDSMVVLNGKAAMSALKSIASTMLKVPQKSSWAKPLSMQVLSSNSEHLGPTARVRDHSCAVPNYDLSLTESMSQDHLLPNPLNWAELLTAVSVNPDALTWKVSALFLERKSGVS